MKAKLECTANAASLKIAKSTGRLAAKKIAEAKSPSPVQATTREPRLPPTPPTDSSVFTAHFLVKNQSTFVSAKEDLTQELADSVDYRLRLGAERHEIRRILREDEEATDEVNEED